VASQSDKSALYILVSLFLWFLGYQGVLPFVGKYSTDVLGTSAGNAALAAGMVGVAYAIFAIPQDTLHIELAENARSALVLSQ